MKKDKQTVSGDGKDIEVVPEGVTFKEMKTHVDERGFVCEMFDSRWTWHKDPLVFAYMFTVRPGMTKGWGVHKKHDDRYFMMYGSLAVILYDGRKNSKTYKMVSKVYLSDSNRRLISIPKGVWHAIRNVGTTDVTLANFPTICYDHQDPDKYRLPLNSKKIPYKFENPKGW